MGANITNSLSLQQTLSTDMEVAYGQEDKQCIECVPPHVCRQCNACWSGPESIGPPQSKTTKAPTLKERFVASYRRYPWCYRIFFGVIIVVVALIIALSVELSPGPPFGVYRKGTGFVVLDRGDDSYLADIFFQHESGQIRHIVWDSATNDWHGCVSLNDSSNGLN